jgi:hypothetical protein
MTYKVEHLSKKEAKKLKKAMRKFCLRVLADPKASQGELAILPGIIAAVRGY